MFRIRPVGSLLAVLLLSAALLPAAEKPKPPDPVGKMHVYKKVADRELKLYVITPPDGKPADKRPAIVFFHGGGWVNGAPSQFNVHGQYLASRGMVAVQVQYRLLTKGNESPLVCIQDAKSSMRWVRSHAADLGIDPARIASAGGSAGGHLAAFVGMVDGLDDPADDKAVSPKSNAMILFNPVYDNSPGNYGNKRVGERYKEFSPAQNASADDPPALVLVGSKDPLIPVKTIEAFDAALEAAGVRCDTHLYEGQPHGFYLARMSDGKYHYETLLEVDKFFASLGWLKGPPTLEPPTPQPPPAAKP